MDNTKIWMPIVALVLVLGGAFLYRHFEIVDKANNDRLNARAVLESTRDSHAAVKASYELQKQKVDAAAAKIREAQSRLDAAEKLLEASNQKERLVEGELKYLLGSMPSAVTKITATAVGLTLGDITLADGKVLRGVSIRKVAAREISFIHSEGLSNVPVANLPKDIVDRFDLGPDGLVAKLDALAERARNPAVSVTSPSARIPTLEVSGKDAPMTANDVVDAGKVKGLRIKIVDVESKMQAVRNAISAYERQVSDNSAEAAAAKSRGIPSSRYTSAAEEAMGQVQVQKNFLIQLEAEKKKLKIELDEEMARH